MFEQLSVCAPCLHRLLKGVDFDIRHSAPFLRQVSFSLGSGNPLTHLSRFASSSSLRRSDSRMSAATRMLDTSSFPSSRSLVTRMRDTSICWRLRPTSSFTSFLSAPSSPSCALRKLQETIRKCRSSYHQLSRKKRR